MKMKIMITLTAVLFSLLLSAPGRTAEIRQERYNFPMELIRIIPGHAFVLGEFPPLSLPGPPRFEPVSEKVRSILAVRAGSRVVSLDVPAESGEKNDVKCAIPPVLFAKGSAALSGSAVNTLMASLVRCIARDTPLVVTGYTCDLGLRNVNDLLARQRAEAVAEFLRTQGFTVANVRGKGKSYYRTAEA